MKDCFSKPPKCPVHEEWDFCTRCFYDKLGNQSIANIYPFATELRKWLRQEPSKLPVIFPGEQYLMNPFSHHSSRLVSIFIDVVNDFSDFINSRDKTNLKEPWKIDLKRIRIASEMILYAVRICESLFKQLLYCTQFDPKRYWNKPLGPLLAQRCLACKGKNKHQVSIVGSLAHRYKLCGQYEQCLQVDLKYLNKLRNSQAAHATVDKDAVSSTIEKAWITAENYCNDIGSKFIHMLGHISEIELAMINEAENRLKSENRSGKYNSGLVSTYYWEKSFLKLILVLRRRQYLLQDKKLSPQGRQGCQG